MNMFNNSKTIVKYFIEPYTSNLLREIPLGIFPDIQTNNNNVGCPSVSSANDRLFTINSYMNIDIKFGLKNNEAYYEYEIKDKHPYGDDMHRFIADSITSTYQNGVVHLQIINPYYLVTDDKELEIYTLDPYNKTSNCSYVSGAYRPYDWIRNFNSTYILNNVDKPATIKLRLNNPYLKFISNKKLDIEYFNPSQKILDYHKQSRAVVNYRLSLSDVYKTVLNRRPKKLLG